MTRKSKSANSKPLKVGAGNRQATPSKPIMAKTQKIKGKGDYFLPGSFERLGREAGSAAGSWLGGRAGALLSTVTGMGDYQVNSIINADRALTAAHPKSYEFTNTELVQVVASPGTAFTSYQYANNPGLGSFPWLSAVAQRFNKYRFKQLVYLFESTSSEYASGSGLGTVALATNYDAVDRQFASMVEMEATENAVSGKPSVNKLHGVECSPAENNLKWYYVRSGPAPTNTDIRMYDFCDTTLAVEGLSAPAGVIIGRLKVFYTVEFTNPIALGIPAPFLPSPVTLRSWYSTTAGAAGDGPYLGLTSLIGGPMLGTSSPWNPLPFTVGGGGSGSYSVSTFPVFDVTGDTLTFYARGAYHVVFRWNFSTAPAVTTMTDTSPGNLVVYNPYSATVAANDFSVVASTDRTSLTAEAVLYVNSASSTTPVTCKLAKSGAWGAAFVVSGAAATVTYLGQP